MNIQEIIRNVEAPYLKKDLPDLQVGDYVKMLIKVKEAEKVRTVPFEGTIIRMTSGGASATFTVRKISFGEGVERTFPLHSPWIDKIDIVRRGRVRRAKLYYLRGRVGKAARVKKRDV